YPHELWTTRLLARHAREYGPAAGHDCLARLVQGTVCKILNRQAVKAHKVRYYLERRDSEFEEKMAQVLCVYREVALLKEAAAEGQNKPPVVVSYDEKPGIQAIWPERCRPVGRFLRPHARHFRHRAAVHDVRRPSGPFGHGGFHR